MVGCPHRFPKTHLSEEDAIAKGLTAPFHCQSLRGCGNKNLPEIARCNDCKKIFCVPCAEILKTTDPSTSPNRPPWGSKPA